MVDIDVHLLAKHEMPPRKLVSLLIWIYLCVTRLEQGIHLENLNNSGSSVVQITCVYLNGLTKMTF